MARSTKKSSNRSTVSRRKSKKSNLNLINTVKNSRVLMFVLIFAIVGAALAIRSLAQSDLPAGDKTIVAAYYSSKPTVIRADKETGEFTYDSYTASQLVLADGTLLCDDGNSEGTVTTGKLPRGQTAKLQKEIKDLGVDTVSDVVGDDSRVARVSNNEGFVLASRKKVKAIEVLKGAGKPDKLVKMQEKIQKACEKATDKVQRGSTPEFTIPTSSASADQTILNRLANAFSPKVSAVPPPPVYIKTAHADNIANLVNNYRASNGRARLTKSACMNEVAFLHAKRMAEQDKIFHNQNLLNEMYWVCYKEGLRGNNPPTAPPSNWSFMTENVGVGWGADGADIFGGYKNSAAHNNNMLSPYANRIGSGSYQNSVSGKYFHVNIFAAW